jgi:hypothetical protein
MSLIGTVLTFFHFGQDFFPKSFSLPTVTHRNSCFS